MPRHRAIDAVRSEQDADKRVQALTIIAEALAGVPGLPDERLD
jgi:hypothetical protein